MSQFLLCRETGLSKGTARRALHSFTSRDGSADDKLRQSRAWEPANRTSRTLSLAPRRQEEHDSRQPLGIKAKFQVQAKFGRFPQKIWRTWPSSTGWVIGTLVGVSMLFSGISRLGISLAARRLTSKLA